MLVKDIMNKNVVTIGPDATVQEAAKKMASEKSDCLIVTSNEKLEGIVTDWDFIGKVCAKGLDVKKVKIKDVMTDKVIVTGPDTDIDEVAKIMTEHNIKKVPIVMSNILIGVVTATELIAAEPKLLEEIGTLFMMPKKGKPLAG
jgi:CBS domain-containing protein